MADWGTIAGKLYAVGDVTHPQGVPTFTYVPEPLYNYGTIAGKLGGTGGGGEVEIVEVIVYEAPPPSNEDPGDHISQLLLVDDVDPNLNRHTVYMVGSNVRTVLKEIWIVNSANAARTLDVWIASTGETEGIKRTYDLAAAGSEGDEVLLEMWRVLFPAQLVELESSGTGIAVEISGVEEVAVE
jgi:hypothetical protein